MTKYLDQDGLLYFWQKIKNIFAKASDIPSSSSSSPNMDGTASAGSSTSWSRGDHTHPTDTSRAPVSHATSSTTYGSGSSSNYGHVKLSDSTSSTSSTSSGTAATPKAVKDALDAAKTYADAKADTNTTYTLVQDSTDGHILTFTPSDDDPTVITIPDNNTTDLTQMTGTLSVGHGGTGATTLTGILKGNGTSAFSAASASDIVTLLGTTAVNRATADAAGLNISDTYAKKSEISGAYIYKGSVASENALPQSGQTAGDVYNIEASSTYGPAGTNVAWVWDVQSTGTGHWDPLGGMFTITSITNSEIDTIVAT